MSEPAADIALRRYFRGCTWPCPPDVARAIAADNGAPLVVLLALELVPAVLYESEDALVRALAAATARPVPACFGAAPGLAVGCLPERRNGAAWGSRQS